MPTDRKTFEIELPPPTRWMSDTREWLARFLSSTRNAHRANQQRHTQCLSDRMGHRRPPKAITLTIDDTADTLHGHQQLSLFDARHDERCFMPVHVYDADTAIVS
jgi:hypothetical protein